LDKGSRRRNSTTQFPENHSEPLGLTGWTVTNLFQVRGEARWFESLGLRSRIKDSLLMALWIFR